MIHYSCATFFCAENQEKYVELSHLDKRGNASMVDITHKEYTQRAAMAKATVKFPDEAFTKIFVSKTSENDAYTTSKGDIFGTARIAGIMAAKRTPDLIPLCHNVALSHVELRFEVEQKNRQVNIYARVRCANATGVEMEALTACALASLTLYDMCKALSHDIRITDVKLLGKSGGKTHVGNSDHWPNE